MKISTRRSVITLLCATLLLFGRILRAQQEVPTSPSDDNTVLLIYDEQRIADADRALICALLSESVDERQWSEVTVRKGENIWSIVKNFFDVFKKSYPRTTHTLVKEIKKANHLTTLKFDEDTPIRVPPCPIRGYAWFNYPGLHIRTYRPSTQGYHVAGSLSDLEFSNQTQVMAAKEMGHEKSVNFTAAELNLGTLSLERLRMLKEHLFPGLTVRSKTGYAGVRLYEQDVVQCGDAKEWLDRSPYLASVRRRLAALSEGQKQELGAKARRMPLVILDWKVEPASQGHGAKVLSVAQYLLHSLHLDFLTDSIRRMDLYPGAQNQAELLKWLGNFKTYRAFRFKIDPLSDDFQDAERWIRHPPPPAMKEGALEYQVPEVLVEALLWKCANDRAWVNFSFALYSPALRVLPDSFVMGFSSFGFVAAGNAPLGLTPDAVPQESASTRLNLINVTYGPVDGGVWGAFSDATYHTVVSLVAPGCGFAYGSLVPEDRGSSFASPYVAVASWLKYLLDDVGVQEMRRWLILASRPVPTQKEPVESQGSFDAARLLGFPHQAHYIDSENNLVLLKAAKINFSITSEEGQKESFEWDVGKKKPETPVRSLVIYSDENGQVHALVREVAREHFPQVNLHEGQLIALTLALTKQNGELLPIPGPDKFAAAVKEVCF